MHRFVPTAHDLEAALEEIAYEIEQLIGVCAYLVHHGPRTEATATESPEALLDANVYLECFLLHIRVLLDFLEHRQRTTRRQRELDDVLAVDYGFPAEPVDVPPDLRQRLNQDLAHLSYSRLQRRGPSKDWFPAAIAIPVLKRCDSFATHILSRPGSSLADDVRHRYGAVRDMIRAATGSDDA